MYYPLLISACSLLSLSACSGQKAIEQDTTKEKMAKPLVLNSPENFTKSNMESANIIYFNEGENKFLKDFEMNVTFHKVVEDSRCPTDVKCVWAGVATVEIELMGTYTRPVKVKLATIEDLKKRIYPTCYFQWLQNFSVRSKSLSKNCSK